MKIVHLDADAFFASVEQAADARLRGKVMAVGGKKRGIIASATYEARKLGIYTPMPSSRALKICPDLIIMRGHYERYELFSRFMFSFVRDFTPNVEESGIDEGYFEPGGGPEATVHAAKTIAETIHRVLKIGVSMGVASNKMVAQIASKMHKPRGFVVVPEGREREFLAPLEVKWLPGVGTKSEPHFKAAGFTHIGQVAEASVEQLEPLAGSGAEHLIQLARGIDSRPVRSSSEEEKSFGAQDTFGEDTADEETLRHAMRLLVDKTVGRMREHGKSARTVSVTVRYRDMTQKERGASLDEPGDLPDDFYSEAWRLLKKAWERKQPLRMVRVKLSSIYDTPPMPNLFSRERRERLNAIEETLRDVHAKYGKSSLMRGWWLEGEAPETARPAE